MSAETTPYTIDQGTIPSDVDTMVIGFPAQSSRRIEVAARQLVAGAFYDGPTVIQPIEQDPTINSYHHLKFGEGDPLTRVAWRIHAEGYRAMGFVLDEALTEDGYLAQGIDKARGENVEYYLALNSDNDGDSATIRKVNLGDDQTYRDLPGYQLCKDKISAEGETRLQTLHARGVAIKEIAAMARSEDANPLAVHELIRRVIQEEQGKGEMCFFSVVSTTFESLVKSFGAKNFEVIGEDVPLNDDRVNAKIALRPTLVDLDMFIENILTSYHETDSLINKKRLQRSLIYLTEGLSDSMMSDAVRAARSDFLSGKVTTSN